MPRLSVLCASVLLLTASLAVGYAKEASCTTAEARQCDNGCCGSICCQTGERDNPLTYDYDYNGDDDDDGLSGGAIAGIVFVIILFIILMIWRCYRWAQRSQLQERRVVQVTRVVVVPATYGSTTASSGAQRSAPQYPKTEERYPSEPPPPYSSVRN